MRRLPTGLGVRRGITVLLSLSMALSGFPAGALAEGAGPGAPADGAQGGGVGTAADPAGEADPTGALGPADGAASPAAGETDGGVGEGGAEAAPGDPAPDQEQGPGGEEALAGVDEQTGAAPVGSAEVDAGKPVIEPGVTLVKTEDTAWDGVFEARDAGEYAFWLVADGAELAVSPNDSAEGAESLQEAAEGAFGDRLIKVALSAGQRVRVSIAAGASPIDGELRVVADARDVSAASVLVRAATLEATGEPLAPVVRLSLGGAELVEGADYEVARFEGADGEPLASAPSEPGEYAAVYRAVEDDSVGSLRVAYSIVAAEPVAGTDELDQEADTADGEGADQSDGIDKTDGQGGKSDESLGMTDETADDQTDQSADDGSDGKTSTGDSDDRSEDGSLEPVPDVRGTSDDPDEGVAPEGADRPAADEPEGETDGDGQGAGAVAETPDDSAKDAGPTQTDEDETDEKSDDLPGAEGVGDQTGDGDGPGAEAAPSASDDPAPRANPEQATDKKADDQGDSKHESRSGEKTADDAVVDAKDINKDTSEDVADKESDGKSRPDAGESKETAPTKDSSTEATVEVSAGKKTDSVSEKATSATDPASSQGDDDAGPVAIGVAASASLPSYAYINGMDASNYSSNFVANVYIDAGGTIQKPTLSVYNLVEGVDFERAGFYTAAGAATTKAKAGDRLTLRISGLGSYKGEKADYPVVVRASSTRAPIAELSQKTSDIRSDEVWSISSYLELRNGVTSYQTDDNKIAYYLLKSLANTPDVALRMVYKAESYQNLVLEAGQGYDVESTRSSDGSKLSIRVTGNDPQLVKGTSTLSVNLVDRYDLAYLVSSVYINVQEGNSPPGYGAYWSQEMGETPSITYYTNSCLLTAQANLVIGYSNAQVTPTYTTTLIGPSGSKVGRVTGSGKYTLRLTGTGDWKGTLSIPVMVKKGKFPGGSLSDCSIHVTSSAAGKKPTVSVSYYKSGTGYWSLYEGTHYSVTYGDYSKAGASSWVSVTGKAGSGLEGTRRVTYVVGGDSYTSSKDIDYGYYFAIDSPSGKMSSSTDCAFLYPCGAKPKVSVTSYSDDAALDPKYYAVSYKNNASHGVASVTVTGRNGYTGKRVINYLVGGPDISKAVVSKLADTTYDGKAKKPVPTVSVDGAVLKSGTHFTLEYKNNTKAGTATVTIRGKGSYKGTKSVSFKIKPGFPDVPASHWAAGVVARASDLDLISGYSNGTFGPSDSLTRGQVAIMLWRMAGKPSAGAGAKSFSDVGKSASCYKAVRWASSVGVVSGYASGKFGPSDKVTREQLAAMLANYAKKVAGRDVTGSASDYRSMKDAAKVGKSFRSALGWCYRSKIMGGTADGRIDPKGNATRAQAAKMMVGLFDIVS